MSIIKSLNLGLRFGLELSLLAALGYWGFQLPHSLLRFVGGIGAPLLAAVCWGLFVAPQSPRLWQEPWRFGLELVLFGLAAGALVWHERPFLAAALFIFFLINRILMGYWGQ